MACLVVTDKFGKRTECLVDLPQTPDLKSLCAALTALKNKSNKLLTQIVNEEKESNSLPDSDAPEPSLSSDSGPEIPLRLDVVTSALLYLHVEPRHNPT